MDAETLLPVDIDSYSLELTKAKKWSGNQEEGPKLSRSLGT